MPINVGSLVIKGMYKDVGLVSGIKNTAKQTQTMAQRIKSTVTDTKRMTKATNLLKGALGLMGIGGALAFTKLLMSSPYLAGALAKIKTYVELLAWAMSKHLKPVLDLVARGVKWLYEKFIDLPVPIQKAITWTILFGTVLLGGLGIKGIITKLGTLMGVTGFGGLTTTISATIAKIYGFMAAGSLMSLVASGVIGVGIGLAIVKLMDMAGWLEELENRGQTFADKWEVWALQIQSALEPLTRFGAGIIGLVREGPEGAKEYMNEASRRAETARTTLVEQGRKPVPIMGGLSPMEAKVGGKYGRWSGGWVPSKGGKGGHYGDKYQQSTPLAPYTPPELYTAPHETSLPAKTETKIDGGYNVFIDLSNSDFTNPEDQKKLYSEILKMLDENNVEHGLYD